MMRQPTSQSHPASQAVRSADMVLNPGISIAPSDSPPISSAHYYELSRYDHPDETEPDPIPVWISASLLVAYCAIFWVGAVTIGSWFWHSLSGMILP